MKTRREAARFHVQYENMGPRMLGVIIVVIVLGFLSLASYLILAYSNNPHLFEAATATSTHS